MKRLAATSFLLIPALALAAPPEPRVPLPATVSTSSGDVKLETLATLEYPWGMALLPDGRLLITEKPGRLRIWADGRLSEPVAGVPSVVHRNAEDQGGLLDVAVDPDFARNGRVYLSFVEAAPVQSEDQADTGDTRFGDGVDRSDAILRGGAVLRARLDGDALVDGKVIWRQVPKMVGRGHFGNRLVFAKDGTLFITSGERMRFEPAQSLESNLGKVVHVTADGEPAPGNPFVGKAKALGDVYSLGHRNMLSAAIQPASGRLFVLEMGPQGGDELNVIQAGGNYGWPVVSNGDNYDGSPIADHASKKKEYEAPIRSWTPVISPSGMLFYEGALFPSWRGDLIAGGLSSKCIVRLRLDGDRIADEERLDMKRRIRDVIEAPDGAILAIVDDAKGELLRLTPAERRR